ncbi:unnamed protein product [Caenorhabditis angaria]|uniref:Uncharacterized protein n=1 Tax=Caenorhabditis angaria TaxID=860376 RepID=A0A9P1IS41_9PELO|nr:unnamed protein product [Caenorhabditis angaria]
MQTNNIDEKQRLLDDSKASTARFQVSKTGDGEGKEKSGSEPPPSNIEPTVTRKMSATGRFMVVSENDAKEDELADLREGDKSPAGSRHRGVHFSVGDKENVEEKDESMHRQQSQDHQTTYNMKSWRNMKTIEHPPIIDFYRNSVDTESIFVRPSMAQLINGNQTIPEEIGFEELNAHTHHLEESPDHDIQKPGKIEKMKGPTQQNRVKFGWVQGVFVRCILNIFGVMLYLRLSWVTGQAGIGLGSCIVLLASLVTTITAISTCAICTNGDVKGGGAYFLISRSLGPEFGGSIGIIFSIANAVGAAMYIVGFAETVRDILMGYDMPIFDGGINDVRIIGFITCIILMGIVFIGTEFESKMQMGLLFILLASIVNYYIGTFNPLSADQQKYGITGYKWDNLKTNFLPNFEKEHESDTANHTFFSVFAIYFPAATGIMAGANISGDLADPQKAIPLGTLLAILVTTFVYIATVWVTGATTQRYYMEPTDLFPSNTTDFLIRPPCAATFNCTGGLMHNHNIMKYGSLFEILIIAGIFAATLSSALASLVSAPKVFQAVCKDRLFPKIGYFAKTYGKSEEPKRAYVLGFILALSMVAIGELNAIAPIISNFFLGSYALINYACFDQSFADSPGFRPGFKYYNMWTSLIGAILCVFVMFIIDWATALVTFFCFASIFMYILHRKPDVNWGSSTQAHSYKNALSAMIKLSTTEEHVKNYRPQFLVLTGNPAARPSLVDFANNITKGSSLLICGYVVPYDPSDRVFSVIRKLDRQLNDWLRRRKVKAFYQSVANSSLRIGAQSLLQLTGISKMRPNIVLVGFKSNWYKEGPSEANLNEMNEYFGTIQDVFDCNMGVCVLRNGQVGLDFSEAMKNLNIGETRPIKLAQMEDKTPEEKVKLIEKEEPTLQAKEDDESSTSLNEQYVSDAEEEDEDREYESDRGENEEEDDEEEEEEKSEDIEKAEKMDESERHRHFSLRRRGSRRHTMEQKALLASIARFQRKVKKGVIDVWWLYDDGGLTLLIPHLLTIPKSYLEGARLRIFTISTSSRTMEQEQRGMAALLSKFRIDFSDVSVIADIGKKPRQETMKTWQSIIDPFIAQDGNCPVGMTTNSELSAQRDKTYRQLRAGELLQEHSVKSDLVVMTLPVPRKGMVSSSLYLSWLEAMTRGLPPVLFVRGNQQSVLTFYS